MPYPSDMVQKDTFYFILDPLNGFNSRIKFIILFDSPSHLPLKKKRNYELSKNFHPYFPEKKKVLELRDSHKIPTQKTSRGQLESERWSPPVFGA